MKTGEKVQTVQRLVRRCRGVQRGVKGMKAGEKAVQIAFKPFTPPGSTLCTPHTPR